MATSDRETNEAPPASSSGMIEGALKVMECRSMADKGMCMHFCVCKISIVRTSYESLQEEMIDNVRFVTAPTYRHKLKLSKRNVWKQSKSKECSIHWSKHNAGNFDLTFHRSGRLRWAESKEVVSVTDESMRSEDELIWNNSARNRPRFKFEIFAVGSPSAPKEKFLGQAYLSWDEIAAKLQSPTNHPESKIFLALKPRNLKSRAKGYLVLSCFRRELLQLGNEAEVGDHLRFARAKARMVTDLRLGGTFILRNLATYMKRMVLYCRVGKVENLPPSSSISQLADPYVLLQTHPQASEFSRSARTTTKFQTLSTTFMEPFLFENLRPEVQDLTVSVWDENTGSEHSCLGYVVIPFELVWHNMLKSPAAKKDSDVLDKIEACTMGFELQNAKGKTVLGRNGPSAVHISAWFGTFQETFAACKYSHRGVPGNVGEAVFFEPELRTLHIDILKAKNVPPKILKNGSVAGRNCYCTVSMTGCLQKNSTQVQKATLWPEFNEKFALIVAQNQMHRAARVGDDPHPSCLPSGADDEERGEEIDGGVSFSRYGEGSASHRTFNIGFNDKSLLAVAKKAERESPILTIKMFDYDPINQSLAGDKCLGKIKVPVSNLPTLSGTAAEQNWIPLQCEKRKSMKYTKSAPELCVRACFRSEDRVPLAARKSIGRVSITLKRVYLEGSVAQLASDRGGLYCLVKFGKELVRTPCRQMKLRKHGGGGGSCIQSQSKRVMGDSSRSGYNEYQSLNSMRSYRSQQGTGRSEGGDDVYRSEDGLSVDELQTFHLGDRLMFSIFEPASVVTMGIFDRGDTRLSKIQMKLSTFLQRSNKMLYPISIDLQNKEKSEMRHVGYLEFSLKLDYESKLDLWQRYFALAQPPLNYTDPLPLKIRYNIQLQTHDLLKRSLLQGGTKLPSTVAKDILGTEDLKFSIKNLQSRFASITDSLRSLVPVDITKIKLYDPLSWEKPILSTLIVLAYCILIQYAEFLLPVVFLLLVVAGLSLRKFQREIILYELSRLSKKDNDSNGKQKGNKNNKDPPSYKRALKEAVKMDSTIIAAEGGRDCDKWDWADDDDDDDQEEEEGEQEQEDFSISNLGSENLRIEYDNPRDPERERVLKVKRKVEIVKLEVRDKLLTVKTKVEGKIEVFKMKVGGRVDGVKMKLEDKLEHVNRALETKFPNLKLKMQDLKQHTKAFKRNVKKGVKKRANKVKTKVGEVLQKAGGAIDGVRGLARKEIESKLLAVRKRASLVIVMDKYIQLKRQYEELKAFSGIFQMLLGELNKGLQNVRGLVLWTDPRISFFFVFGCFLFSLFLFWFGMKATLQLAGLYLFRPPWLRDPFPPLAFNPFMRLSSVEESPLWCYIGMRKKTRVEEKASAAF